jgi:two-component system cell cycle sensor histidine kinase/response regulator CckA
VSQSGLLKRLAGEHVHLELALTAEPLHTLFDPGEFEQILLNLVINARDAMPEGGTIRIETAPLGDCISVRVADSGHGIPEEIRHRIFEPNFTTKKDRGIGLGLATVYNILQGVGGQVEVHSIVGRGTTMSILLLQHAEA